MLLLYPATEQLTRLKQLIYIPLCFYFIQSNESWQPVRTSNLHSTMLLLYRRSGNRPVLGNTDLHSTMLLLYPLRGHEPRQPAVIYIPLCFYFITCLQPMREIYGSFTFHYASTLSQREAKEAVFEQIYIPLCFYFIHKAQKHPGASVHLHSTMLLLYRKEDRKRALQEADLHSTMLLLYPYFQQTHNPDNSHLHSTMLLLYP